MNALATKATAGEIMESVIIKGDLAKLDPGDRAAYYMNLCKSVGLNPLTKPLEYITLNGKLTLYAKRDCADQLRKINGISVEIVDQKFSNDLFTVHVRASDASGRKDEDFGVVSLPDTFKGEARANAIMKAITKAKRRVTLSISGLGFLDETEIADIPAGAKRPGPAVELLPQHDAETGEIIEPESAAHSANVPAAEAAPSPQPPSQPGDGAVLSVEDMAREAASRGEDVFKMFYKSRTPAEKKMLNAIGDELRSLMPAQ